MIECDYAVVGSGAGGGILAEAGWRVVLTGSGGNPDELTTSWRRKRGG
jgi:choline dehydrogenase-like flavoprotein